MHCIQVTGGGSLQWRRQWERAYIYGIIILEQDTRGGYAINFKTRRISIVIVEVVIVVVLAIECNYDSLIRSGHAKLFKYCRTGVIRSLTGSGQGVCIADKTNVFGIFYSWVKYVWQRSY